jgi:hypothetical protein
MLRCQKQTFKSLVRLRAGSIAVWTVAARSLKKVTLPIIVFVGTATYLTDSTKITILNYARIAQNSEYLQLIERIIIDQKVNPLIFWSEQSEMQGKKFMGIED